MLVWDRCESIKQLLKSLMTRHTSVSKFLPMFYLLSSCPLKSDSKSADKRAYYCAICVQLFL